MGYGRSSSSLAVAGRSRHIGPGDRLPPWGRWLRSRLHSNRAYRPKATGKGTVDLGDRLVRYRALDRWSGWKGGGVSDDCG
jgi:hypothetical protein